MAPGCGALRGFRCGTPFSSRDETKDRAGLDFRRRVERQAAAVGEDLIAVAHGGRFGAVIRLHRVEGTGAARHVYATRIDEHSQRFGSVHCLRISRCSAGARTGAGSVCRYVMRASRSTIPTGSVLIAALPKPRLSPPEALKLLSTTVYTAAGSSGRPPMVTESMPGIAPA